MNMTQLALNFSAPIVRLKDTNGRYIAMPKKAVVKLTTEEKRVKKALKDGATMERQPIRIATKLSEEACYRVLRSLVARGIVNQMMATGKRDVDGKTLPYRVARYSWAA